MDDRSAQRSPNEQLLPLKVNVSPQLVDVLEKKLQDNAVLHNENHLESASVVKVGTCCQNSGCKQVYVDPSSLEEECRYHPGVPIFHEGMKFWTCCQKRTSEFDSFLNQAGCSKGKHAWTKEAAGKPTVSCRYDWHQTGAAVVLAVYSKGTIPDASRFEANRDRPICDTFSQAIALEGSNVSVTQNKIEIKLKKADPVSWPRLDFVPNT